MNQNEKYYLQYKQKYYPKYRRVIKGNGFAPGNQLTLIDQVNGDIEKLFGKQKKKAEDKHV